MLDDLDGENFYSGGFVHRLKVLCGREDDLPQGTEKDVVDAQTPGSQGMDVPVNTPDGSTQSETSIALNPNTGTICAAWNDASTVFGLSGFGRSVDGELTFTDNGGVSSQDSGDPSLAWSVRDDAFYYAALNMFSGGIVIFTSTDDCVSFTFVGLISNGPADDKELIAIDNEPSSPNYGRIYCAFTDQNILSGDWVVVSFSDDGGVNWSNDVPLAGTGLNSFGAWPAIAPDGTLYVAVLDFTAPSHLLYRSTDGGNTFMQMTNILTGFAAPQDATASANCGQPALNEDIRYLFSPQIFITPDSTVSAGHVVHTAYPRRGGTLDDSSVFYRRSTDGGTTWSAEVQLNDDVTVTDQFYPAIGANSKGTIVASWYDRRLDPGLTWAANIRISDVSSEVSENNPQFDGLADCYHGDYEYAYDQVIVGEDGKGHIIWSDGMSIA